MAFPFLSVSFSHLLCVSGLNHSEIMASPRFGGGVQVFTVEVRSTARGIRKGAEQREKIPG